MKKINVALVLLALLGCGDSTVVEPEARTLFPSQSQLAGSNAHLGALYQLQGAFHGALNASDYDAVKALWAEDATVIAMGNTYTGPDEIAGFFSTSGPFVNGWASLAPSYKSEFEIHGNTATYGFECIYVEDAANLTGNAVQAHLNATGTMRKVGDRWLFQTFVAGAGSL